jgi:hypothetical protein
VQVTDRDGTVAFACAEVEAPIGWSNLAVAVVARRYFAGEPEERSVRALIERVVEAIAGWAQDAGHIRRQRTPVISHARSPARWCDRRTPRTTAHRSFARSRLRRSRNSSAQRLKRILGRLPAPRIHAESVSAAGFAALVPPAGLAVVPSRKHSRSDTTIISR